MRIGFRAKLLVALAGTVGLLLAGTLVSIRLETRRQLERAVTQATERSRAAFSESERFWHTQLERLGLRLAGSVRIPAALQAAIEAGDAAMLVPDVEYELQLAGLEGILVAFTDADGRPVAAILGRSALRDPAEAVPPSIVQRVLATGDPSARDYHLTAGRLFAVQAVPLVLFDNLIGTLILGYPVRGEDALRLGSATGGEVCFAVRDRCIVATPAAAAGLHDLMATGGASGHRFVSWRDQRWALVSDRLYQAGTLDGRRVIAIPLGAVLEPFGLIQRRAALAALAALGLAIGIALVLSRGLARPVRQLVAATERVRRGDYGFRVDVSSRDELGTLAGAFNDMTAGLLLKERYRGLLDKVVSPDVAEELLREEVRLGGESREVTTLFVDIRGFTSLTQGMESQDVVTLLNEYAARTGAAVEAEGGVVDKYVGDGIMALFGAPIARGDEALRAVRAALGIRAALADLNAERSARGEPTIRAGIGISTGIVVAGNMGSAHRLNYTVVGTPVNLAARLCDAAAPSEILLSEETYARVQQAVRARPLGARDIKGFSSPVGVFALDRLREESAPRAGVIATALVTLLVPVQASAQLPLDPPTLAERGIRYVSASGFLEIVPSGRLDLEGYFPQESPPWLIPVQGSFVAPRLRLIVELFAGEHVAGFAELRGDRGEEPSSGRLQARVEQAFVRVTPWRGRELHLQAGKFVTPFGDYAQRHHTVFDPLIRPPLPHDYRTMVCGPLAPGSVDGFLGWKNKVPMDFRPLGAPVVWGVPYQFGALAFGKAGRLSFRVAALSSAPSSEPEEWDPRLDQERNPSVVAHLGWQPLPELALGASYSQGPFMSEELKAPLPAGTSVDDFDQVLWGFHAAFQRGSAQLRGELFLDDWHVANVPQEVRDVSYYLEAVLTLAPGLYTAARYSAIHFNELTRSDGRREPWDYDIRRWQLGAGYRLARNLGVRAEYAWNRALGPVDPRDDLASVQAWWLF
ncbi:MAG: adenylate/guanylate cyclase domain-containing protein [Gemmatimonadetes bacterium]|nr:adenylate/guanylate cyclase domain-containing protein [Gemmatimonadota bacterium]